MTCSGNDDSIGDAIADDTTRPYDRSTADDTTHPYDRTTADDTTRPYDLSTADDTTRPYDRSATRVGSEFQLFHLSTNIKCTHLNL